MNGAEGTQAWSALADLTDVSKSSSKIPSTYFINKIEKPVD